MVYAKKTSAQWTFSTVAQNIYTEESWATFQLRLDSSEQPHVIWSITGAHYARLIGSSWFTYTLSQSATSEISFDLDSSDRPHFAIMTDAGFDYTLQYWH